MREGFVFGSQRGGGDVRNHEAGIDAAVFHQKRWQAGQCGIDQQGDAPLGQRADFSNGQRQIVRRKRHRLGVEIAARQHLTRVRKNQRVVRHAVGFIEQHTGCVANLVETRTHHLRLAAQAVRILHLVAINMGDVDFGIRQQRAIRHCHILLAAVAAQLVDARIKRRHRAGGGIHRHRP